MNNINQHTQIIVAFLLFTLFASCKKEAIDPNTKLTSKENNQLNIPLKISYTNSKKAIYILTFSSTTDSTKYFSTIVAPNSINAELAIPQNTSVGYYDILINTEGANKSNSTNYNIGEASGSINKYPALVKNVDLLKTKVISLQLR